MKYLLLLFFAVFVFSSCDQETMGEDITPIESPNFYFPPIDGSEWAESSPATLDWDKNKLSELYTFLESNNTRAFILLKDGKIVVEKYWGKNILNTANFGPNTNWYWASAGKTITSFLIGLAQEQGHLNIENKSADYLGEGWTSLPKEKEDLITVRHQLTMTTGVDYRVPDTYCTTSDCLQYRADAGTQWFYHNATYTLLKDVVSNAVNKDYNTYTNQVLESKIGMTGDWVNNGPNNVYWSTARDAARFGLLILNKGVWGTTPIMEDSEYFEAMINTSQNLNPSYGYLWWLNGKEAVIMPGLPTRFRIPLAEDAPAELFAAMGKNGQIIDIVPSEGLVVVRMGEAPDNALVPVKFHNDMWAMLSPVVLQ